MKATGIIRKLDNLGRVVIPKETRDILGMDLGTPIEFFVEEDKVILRKYKAVCVCCGNIGDKDMNGVTICNTCIDKIKEL